MSESLPKIIAIVGPTASGKSSLAIEVARKFDGEIISADSRQIYKGLDIGTGKTTREELGKTPQHMVDIVSPGEKFSAHQFKERAEEVIDDVLMRDKLPIVEGGTGFYVDVLIYGITPPAVSPDPKLRKELEKLNAPELLLKLKELDKERAKKIDPHNERRLIRAIEIAKSLGHVPKQKITPKYNCLQFGVRIPKEELKTRIENRVRERIENGWIEEVKELLDKNVSRDRFNEFGLGYKLLADVILNKRTDINKAELIEEISASEWRYAKRQMTWFERDENIKWFSSENKNEIFSRIEIFLQ